VRSRGRRTGARPRAGQRLRGHAAPGRAEATTARARQPSLRRICAWLADEEEIDRDRLLGLKPPTLDQKIVERLTDDQRRALVKACAGKNFRNRSDEAIVRFMLECIVRPARWSR
jgi:site-specific recombinase XerC